MKNKIKNWFYNFFRTISILIIFINNFIIFVGEQNNLLKLIYSSISLFSFILITSEIIGVYSRQKYEIEYLKTKLGENK